MTPYYEADGVTIYHGDALDVLPSLPMGIATAVVTDPPYVIGAVSAGNMATKAGGWGDMMNSALWFSTWYRMVDRLLLSRGSFWTFCNWRSLPVVMRAATDARLPITSTLVWDKEWIGPGGSQGLRPSYEMVALGHPAEKPEALVRRILTVAAVPTGELVVDPFMGCGTTAVSASILGLRFVGVESEERWCEVAAQRLAQCALFGAAS